MQTLKVAHKLVTDFCLEAVKDLHLLLKEHCKFQYTTLSRKPKALQLELENSTSVCIVWQHQYKKHTDWLTENMVQVNGDVVILLRMWRCRLKTVNSIKHPERISWEREATSPGGFLAQIGDWKWIPHTGDLWPTNKTKTGQKEGDGGERAVKWEGKKTDGGEQRQQVLGWAHGMLFHHSQVLVNRVWWTLLNLKIRIQWHAPLCGCVCAHCGPVLLRPLLTLPPPFSLDSPAPRPPSSQ